MLGFKDAHSNRRTLVPWCTTLVALFAVSTLVLTTGCPPPTPTPTPDPLAVTAEVAPATGAAPLGVVASATATGGTAPYTYSWAASPAATLNTPTQATTLGTLTNAGTYTLTVTVTDAAGVTASASATATATAPPTPPAVTVTATGPATSTGGSTETITALAAGGTAPFTYNWQTTASGTAGSVTLNPADGIAQAMQVTFSADADGTYTFEVTVVDAAAQTAQATVSIDVTASGTSASTTFTLGVDNLPATAGDATYTAAPALTGFGVQANTLQTGDAADGGPGADTLDATLVGAAGGAISATLANIETLNFTDHDTGGAWVITGTNITGATAVNLMGSTNAGNVFTINNLPTALTAVGIYDTPQDLTVTFQAAATAAADDALAVTISGSTTDAGANRSTVTLTPGAANGYETLDIMSTGSANDIQQITQGGASLATVNIAGDQNLRIRTALDNSVTTVDASALTGNLTELTVGNGVVAFTGGAGDDTVIYGANYATTDVIDGGAGTDTLGLTVATANVAVAQTNVSGIEQLRISDAINAALTLSYWGVITGVTADAGFNTGTLTVETAVDEFNVAAGAFGANNDSAGAATVTMSGGGTADVVNLTLNDSDVVGAVTLNGVETLNLASNIDLDGTAADGDVNVLGAALTLNPTFGTGTVNITGTEALTITGVVTAGTIDASAFAQVLTMASVCANAVNITGGSAADVLFGSDSQDVIDGGAGNDVIDAGDGNDFITGGAGNDTFVFAAGDLLAAPSSTNMDRIADFETNADIIDHTAALAVVANAAAAIVGAAQINAEGICTFAAADDTLAERIVAAEGGINAGGAAAAGQFAVFEADGSSYVFISDGVDGIGANDVLIELTGVTGLSDTTLTGGNLTIQ